MSTPKPPNRVRFRYDQENDVIIASPDWRIDTAADVATWAAQYVAFIAPFRRKMDLIIDLEKFDVVPQMGVEWGAARAEIAHQYLRFHVRVHANQKVKMFVNTSGVRHDIATEEVASVEAAIEVIKRARVAAAAVDAGPRSLRNERK